MRESAIRWLAAGLALAALAGCRGVAPPRLDDAAARLEWADQQFERGDLAAAAIGYGEFLAVRPEHPRAAELLFRLALIDLLPEGGPPDDERARRRVRQLRERFPESPYRRLAEELLRQTEERRELERQLRLLKQIDLERRRNRPPG